VEPPLSSIKCKRKGEAATPSKNVANPALHKIVTLGELTEQTNPHFPRCPVPLTATLRLPNRGDLRW